MARPSGRTNSVKGLVGVAIIRLVGRRAETPLRRGQGKSDLPLLLCRLERFRFGAFSLCWHPDLATVRASLAVFRRASCWGLLFEQDKKKNARHSLPFDDVESLNRKIFRPTSEAWQPDPGARLRLEGKDSSEESQSTHSGIGLVHRRLVRLDRFQMNREIHLSNVRSDA